MMRSLWTAASGMIGQQFSIDTIANNLSTVNTTGFKQNRPDFEDLLYQTVRMAGTPATEQTLVPVGVQVGHGVRVAATQKIFTQGSLQNTENVGDVAIEGEGFCVDTPGIKSFGMWDLAEDEVQKYYFEIDEISAGCKYPDCSHRHEPDCAVQKALEAEEISRLRFDSYCALITSLKEKPKR